VFWSAAASRVERWLIAVLEPDRDRLRDRRMRLRLGDEMRLLMIRRLPGLREHVTCQIEMVSEIL